MLDLHNHIFHHFSPVKSQGFPVTIPCFSQENHHFSEKIMNTCWIPYFFPEHHYFLNENPSLIIIKSCSIPGDFSRKSPYFPINPMVFLRKPPFFSQQTSPFFGASPRSSPVPSTCRGACSRWSRRSRRRCAPPARWNRRRPTRWSCWKTGVGWVLYGFYVRFMFFFLYGFYRNFIWCLHVFALFC